MARRKAEGMRPLRAYFLTLEKYGYPKARAAANFLGAMLDAAPHLSVRELVKAKLGKTSKQ